MPCLRCKQPHNMRWRSMSHSAIPTADAKTALTAGSMSMKPTRLKPLHQAATYPLMSPSQNCRDEVRLFGGDGYLAGALSAEPGMKQQTFVAGCFKPGQSAASRSIGYEEDIAPSLEGGGGGNNTRRVASARSAQRHAESRQA